MSAVARVLEFTVNPPSIFQQRVVAGIFLGAISLALWWGNASDKVDYSVHKVATTPMPSAVSALDFSNAEASWSGLQFDSAGKLEINSQTESALSDAIAIIPEREPAAAVARLRLLLEKQFGPEASRQVTDLIVILKDYKMQERVWWEKHGSTQPPAYGELFQLQDDLLGEHLAKKLFAEQRRLAKLMLASHQIRNDSSLSDAERKEALGNLQSSYRAETADD